MPMCKPSFPRFRRRYIEILLHPGELTLISHLCPKVLSPKRVHGGLSYSITRISQGPWATMISPTKVYHLERFSLEATCRMATNGQLPPVTNYWRCSVIPTST